MNPEAINWPSLAKTTSDPAPMSEAAQINRLQRINVVKLPRVFAKGSRW